jgi:hypothetical protein
MVEGSQASWLASRDTEVGPSAGIETHSKSGHWEAGVIVLYDTWA